jgi:phosphatidylserine synthase
MLQIMFLVSLESSTTKGAWAWFHDVWTCGAKVLEYWMISSLKIKSNRSWNFQRNSNVPLVMLERFLCTRFSGIHLIGFGFKVWKILILKWFLFLKIHISSKKPSFGRKN